jgi:hypothetical protein
MTLLVLGLAGCFVSGEDRAARFAARWDVPERCDEEPGVVADDQRILDAQLRVGGSGVGGSGGEWLDANLHVTTWGTVGEVVARWYRWDPETVYGEAGGVRALERVAQAGRCFLYAATLADRFNPHVEDTAAFGQGAMVIPGDIIVVQAGEGGEYGCLAFGALWEDDVQSMEDDIAFFLFREWTAATWPGCVVDYTAPHMVGWESW